MNMRKLMKQQIEQSTFDSMSRLALMQSRPDEKSDHSEACIQLQALIDAAQDERDFLNCPPIIIPPPPPGV